MEMGDQANVMHDPICLPSAPEVECTGTAVIQGIRMCVTYFAMDTYRDLALLLAFNRDEFLTRPTHASHFWPDAPHILAGRDEEGHGTWLGVSITGRVAALTNLRETEELPSAAAGLISRGALTTNFLSCRATPEEYLQGIDTSAYAGFNLLVCDLPSRELWYLSNSKLNPLAATPQRLHAHSIYGLSNGILGAWPKVSAGVQVMQGIMEGADTSITSGRQWPWQRLLHELLCSSIQQRTDNMQHASGTQSPSTHDRAGSGTAHDSTGNCQHTSSSSTLCPVTKKDAQGTSITSGAVNQAVRQPEPPGTLDFVKDRQYICNSRYIEHAKTPMGMYGTRSQILLAVWTDGQAEMRERYWEDGEWQDVTHRFSMRVSADAAAASGASGAPQAA